MTGNDEQAARTPSEHPDAASLPTFGPSEIFGGIDELEPPVAVVRVAFALTRSQLATALGMSFAEIAADRTPESLTDAEVRNEIELHLMTEAVHSLDQQMERDARRDWPADTQRVLDVLAAAVDRAYTRREVVREMQRPYSYSDGTVLLNTLDRGEVLIAEPAWCKGHDGDAVGTLAEISHEGAATVADVDSVDLGDVRLLSAHLSQAPYLDERPEPHPLMYVEGMEAAAYDSQRLRMAAARLVVFAGHLRDEARRLEEFEQGDQS